MKIPPFLICLLLPLTGLAQFSPTPQPPLISVSGSAEVKVAPDQIELRVGVESRSPNLDEAKQQNDDRIAACLKFLKENGIESKNIQTDFISVEPSYPYDKSKAAPEYFTVRRSIEVKLMKIEGFEAILTGLIASGVNAVHGVEFRTSELRKYRDQARAMAVRAAREKADALAAELGVKRGRVYTINANEWGGTWFGSGSYWGRSYGGGMAQNSVQNAGGNSDGGEEGLSLGQISVSATVNVAFLIE